MFSFPVILNPLTVSIQINDKKGLILDLKHLDLHVFKQKFKGQMNQKFDIFYFSSILVKYV